MAAHCQFGESAATRLNAASSASAVDAEPMPRINFCIGHGLSFAPQSAAAGAGDAACFAAGFVATLPAGDGVVFTSGFTSAAGSGFASFVSGAGGGAGERGSGMRACGAGGSGSVSGSDANDGAAGVMP